MPSDDEAVTVADASEQSRYEIHRGSELAGFAEYTVEGDRAVFTHTEIDERFEGQGLGSKLVAGALDGERARGRQVEPRCPFVAEFIRRHPDYLDVVDEEHRAVIAEAAAG
jgi:uncharacterized protein